MIKQSFFLILLLGFILVPGISVYAYNSGFQPVYQPPSPPGGISNIHDIGNVTSIGCALGQVLAVNGSAIWACASGGSGEINTASSSGHGQSLVLAKNVFDLPFKGIAVSGDLTISSNATDVTIGHVASGGGNATVLNDLGDVFTAPVFGEVLYYDGSIWEEHILILQQDLGDVSITLAERGDFFWYDGTYWIDKIFAINTQTCSAGQFVSAVNNQTGVVTCSTPTGSGNMTVLNDGGDVTITSPSPLSVLYYVGSQWIDKIFSINSVTGSAGKLLYSVDNQTGAIGTATIKNKLLDGSNHTDTTAQDPTRGSIIYVDSTAKWNELAIGSNGQVLTSGASDISWVTPSSGSGITTLVSNVTRTAPPASAHALVWTIALTANSGNAIEGVLIASSNTAGVAVQAGANVTNLGSRGYCHWSTPTTSALTVLDNLVMNTVLTGSVTDTGETTWLPAVNVALPISFNCAINTGATPGNLKIYFQPETTGTASIKAGSFYIKTP